MKDKNVLVVETIDVHGIAVEIARGGSGPTLLYLHDGDGVEQANPFLNRLAATFAVIAPSHPGFGASALPGHFSSVDDLAFFYLDLIEQLDLRDVTLVGASFGAWLAAEIAIRSVERIARVALVGPVGAKLNDTPDPDLTDIFSLGEADLAKALFVDPPGSPDYSKLDAETVARMTRNREGMALFAWAPTLCNPKLRWRLHRIKRPALVLRGVRDGVVPLHYAKAFAAALPDARFIEIDHAAHFAHAEQADACAAHVVAFAGQRGTK